MNTTHGRLFTLLPLNLNALIMATHDLIFYTSKVRMIHVVFLMVKLILEHLRVVRTLIELVKHLMELYAVLTCSTGGACLPRGRSRRGTIYHRSSEQA